MIKYSPSSTWSDVRDDLNGFTSDKEAVQYLIDWWKALIREYHTYENIVFPPNKAWDHISINLHVWITTENAHSIWVVNFKRLDETVKRRISEL